MSSTTYSIRSTGVPHEFQPLERGGESAGNYREIEIMDGVINTVRFR